jgi:transposase
MKTKKTRKKYTKEFKLDVVQQSYQRDNLSELARELGLQPKSIYRWRDAYEAKPDHAFPGKGKRSVASDQIEFERLKAENAELRMERDILKKAIGIFGKTNG